jgi:heme-degrading monooxygenase HmoA
MVIRIGSFKGKPQVEPEKMLAFRAWMKSQPGFIAAWHAHDPETDKAVSISVWQDRAALLALKSQKFPGGPLNRVPEQVELYDDAEAF